MRGIKNRKRAIADSVVNVSKCGRLSMNLMELDDYLILEIIDRMDLLTKEAFALTCRRFETLLKNSRGHMQESYPELRLKRDYRINSERIECGRGSKASRNVFKTIIGHNLSELSFCNVRIMDNVRYNVHFDHLKFISLEMCEFKNFNYLWEGCRSSLEHLVVSSTSISEPYHYQFDKLNKVDIARFNYTVKEGNDKLLFSLNPSIKIAVILHFDRNVIKDIYKSNIEELTIEDLTEQSQIGFGSRVGDLINAPIRLKYVEMDRDLFLFVRPADAQRWLLDLCHNGVKKFCLNKIIFNKKKFQKCFPDVDFGNQYLHKEYDEWPTSFVEKNYDSKYL